jgi:hypothetical protein
MVIVLPALYPLNEEALRISPNHGVWQAVCHVFWQLEL